MVVKYDTKSHLSILTQMHGSEWKQVLPYCLLNVILLVSLTILDKQYGYKFIAISNQGHTFVTMIVSFLVVTRVTQALLRYYEARSCIGIMYKELRELAQYICTYTGPLQTESDKEWRYEVSYRLLILLRACMEVIDYPSRKSPPWKIPQLNGIELQYIEDNIMIETPNNLRNVTSKYRHNKRTEWEETLRVPVLLGYLLRKSIRSQITRLSTPMVINVELKLMSSVDNFMSGYYTLRKFLTTPVPFPLVQMTRTFVFTYVFSVPFVFVSDSSSILAHSISVFVLTYGFMGLELLAMELDDPFGDDDNDFDNVGLAEKSYEDLYLAILDVDGHEWTDKLRLRMHRRIDQSKPIDEQTALLDFIV